jgi:hypothetical protein
VRWPWPQEDPVDQQVRDRLVSSLAQVTEILTTSIEGLEATANEQIGGKNES